MRIRAVERNRRGDFQFRWKDIASLAVRLAMEGISQSE